MKIELTDADNIKFIIDTAEIKEVRNFQQQTEITTRDDNTIQVQEPAFVILTAIYTSDIIKPLTTTEEAER